MNRRLEQYRRISPTPWNGNPIYSESADKYFRELEEIFEYYEETASENPDVAESMLLYQSKPVYLEPIDLDRQADAEELPEGIDSIYELIPEELKTKLDEINNWIKENRIELYFQPLNETIELIKP